MPQGVLPFKYEDQRQGTGLTGIGGLPVYMDLAQRLGLASSIDEHVGLKADRQGWTDSEIVMSLVWLNLVGGESVEDLCLLQADEGFCRLLDSSRLYGMKRRERRELTRRWRKERKRSVPSPSAVFRYLSRFTVEGEPTSVSGRAHIPEPGKGLSGMFAVNRAMLAAGYGDRVDPLATLDMDATLVETLKREALFCYKGYRSYQPFNVWWAEAKALVHSEFRDGNVPAGHEQLRMLTESLEALPAGVEKVRMRSDTAGYQHELLQFCESGKHERFGRIEFAVGCDVTTEFKRAVAEVSEKDWQPLQRLRNGVWEDSGREWAEVCFVPNAIAHSKSKAVYRYLATREALREQRALPGMEEDPGYDFATIGHGGKRYKVFGIVTNMDWDGGDLIRWLNARCGQSEEANRAIKEDFAGGRLPSGRFYENAAWWWIAVLSYNLNAIMKERVLDGEWVKRKMKAIRFGLIRLPAQILERSRQLRVRLCRSDPRLAWIVELRRRVCALAAAG